MLLHSCPASYNHKVLSFTSKTPHNHRSHNIQSCANFCHRTPQDQIQGLTLSKQQNGSAAGVSAPRDSTMSQSRFPGSNLFGSGGFGERSSGGPAPVSKIVEEDEGLPSPTDPTFRGADPGRSASSSGESYFRGGGFGEAAGTGRGSFARNPFGGAGDQPEGHQEGDPAAPGSFRPTGGTHEGGLPNNYALGRRTSVSAESLNPTTSGSESWTPPYHPKNPEQLSRLQTAVSGNFLFSHLDEDQFKTVLDALVEKPIPAKDIKVITQGDAGDFFYIVEEGVFDIFIHPSGSVQPGTDGLGTKVNSIGPGGSFGELALMYNAPRAATVVSTQPRSTLWALDRITFRRILMDSAFQRRRMYEAFLEEVPLLSTLKPYERAKIADALDTVRHPAGATIIREGDRGTTFYLLESGEAEAYKEGIQGPVKYYERGDFFGELALLDDKPRAASIVAKTDVKVAQLGRDGFKRLLGPVQDIMRRAKYDTAAAAKEGE